MRKCLIDLARFDLALDESIKGELLELQDDEWPQLFQLASAHRVLANLSRVVANMVEAPPLSISAARRQLILFKRQAAMRKYESESAIEVLRNKGVKVVALKGLVLGIECYPEFYLRETGDLDILIDLSELLVATDALLAEGFTRSQTVPGTGNLEEISVARLDGYASELQHVGEFTKLAANGSMLTIDIHYRLSTIFDHLSPRTDFFLNNTIVSSDLNFFQFRPELFVSHLGYHAWWDTQSLTNVRSGLDLRLFQYSDILLAFKRWNLTCSEVIRWSEQAGTLETSNWALWLTSRIFGSLPGDGVIDVDAAEKFDKRFSDRWIQRSTVEPLGEWGKLAFERIFDLTRGDQATAMITNWIDGHTKKGDILEWVIRENM